METLKKSLVVILGVLLISSFVTNVNHQPATTTELSNGEKNIELIKKLMKENEFEDVKFYFVAPASSINPTVVFKEITVSEESLSFDNNIVVKLENEQHYFNPEKILDIKTQTGKKDNLLIIKLM